MIICTLSHTFPRTGLASYTPVPIRQRFLPDRDRFLLLHGAPAPPVPRRAHRLLREDEAGDVDHVEEQVAHDVRRLGSHQLQAIAEPLVAGAMHHCVGPNIGQSPLGLTRFNAERASKVMMPATPIRPSVTSHVNRRVGTPPLATPISAGHPAHVNHSWLLVGPLGKVRPAVRL